MAVSVSVQEELGEVYVVDRFEGRRRYVEMVLEWLARIVGRQVVIHVVQLCIHAAPIPGGLLGLLGLLELLELFGMLRLVKLLRMLYLLIIPLIIVAVAAPPFQRRGRRLGDEDGRSRCKS